MIAIGIPSYNESDSISRLVTEIDKSASVLGIPIIIINSDNNSPDGTSSVFNNTTTKAKKISLINKNVGKGHNVFAIFQKVLKEKNVNYLFLIDADIESYSPEWLLKHKQLSDSAVDYVLPNYKRKYIEGNGTNHFAYPVMKSLLQGSGPRQPIAGDIGLSRRFIEHLMKQEKPESSFGYGIDMFISTHSVAFNGEIREIYLGKKIHKPSFPKMIKIFQDEASSYYSVRSLNLPIRARFYSQKSTVSLLDSPKINPSDIQDRLNEAKDLHNISKSPLATKDDYFSKGRLDYKEWVDILIEHEKVVGKYSPEILTRSITPFYLLRAVTYLMDTDSPEDAKDQIETQANEFVKKMKNI
jgi:hypothetical protein